LKQTFPSVTLVVDPQLQMQRELDALRQTHGGLLFNDFEPLLQNATTLMTSANQKPTSIDYSAHQLKIKGIDPDTATLHRAQAKLNEQRLQVQLDADGNLTLWAGGTP
jgi:general secretion pathway protein L